MMADFITREQFHEIGSSAYFVVTEFHRVLEHYTGIDARPYVACQYFDACGNYIGDSVDMDLIDLLNAAHIEVKSED